ncbi:TonB-dependent receptor [Chitinophaga nivalis]|uniref:Carboxypeptidase-like regulatory domain-containing protein n=1 Tax=Chitinophaga nivalis TaxID=2991709 RepID=A0ABT3ITT8_9BACT|nr:carboxypeptidase-like regulatory domain-containing protein [Chitinophaga nivalis]MCW3487391.1 carboxypeptidase-like regulatory domain-containing protein [Chitinophaga nivalis]
MKRNLPAQLWVLVLLLIGNAALAGDPSKITGKVTDKKSGEPLIGLTVMITGAGKGAVTDVEGRYTLSVQPGSYTLEFKFMGYQTKSVAEVIVTTGKPTYLDIVMEERSSKSLKEVVISGTAKQETINSLLTLQKNTNTVAQVVSAEAIRKSPDRNTGEVLKRVSGASMQDGKYLVVRGLADRYNQATVNGALLSSTEPDRKSFSFDLFPSNIVENIVINKAAVPELPGEFAGGLVQVNTKDIPSENFLTVMAGTGFNTQSAGKDFYTYKGGNRDWLGYDDGTRALPAGFPGSKTAYDALSTEQKLAASKSFPNIWETTTKSAPLNSNFQLAGGINKGKEGRRFGAVFSLSYNRNNRNNDTYRSDFDNDGTRIYNYYDKKSTQNVLWGGLANLSYQFGKNKLSFKNLYSVNSTVSTTVRTGDDIPAEADVRSYELGFNSNKIYTSQLTGDHFWEKAKVKIKWNGSYTNMRQDVPDLRRLSYNSASGKNDFYANISSGGSATITGSGRFFSKLNDNIYGGSVDMSRFVKIGNQQQQIKLGYLIQSKDRDFAPRALGYTLFDASDPYARELIRLTPDKLFSQENFTPRLLRLDEITNEPDAYRANALLNAGYLQFDNSIRDKWRIVWGVRVENFDQTIKYKQNGEKNNKTTVTDVMPSVNLAYLLNAKTNIRLSASQTVIRPEFREQAPFAFYNFDLMATESGNTNLKRSKVTNLDLRYELYPRSGEVFTVGAFYKYFESPIERFYNSGAGSVGLTYLNAPKASSAGAEVEFRKNLDFLSSRNAGFWHCFTVFSNISYIYNKVSFEKEKVLKSRPMQGQSPYVINAGLQFEKESTGTVANVLFNRIGRRIFIVGNDTEPDVYEAPRSLLDFMVSQRIFRKGEIKLTVSDILNQSANFYQDINDNGKYDKNSDFLRISTKTGTNVNLSFSYKF